MAGALAVAEDSVAKPLCERAGAPPRSEDMMMKLDTNGDKMLSLEEFKAGPRAQKDPAKAAEMFGRLDADKNGSVTVAELKAFHPPHPPHHHRGPVGKGGKGGPGGPGGPSGKGGPAGSPPVAPAA